MCTHRCKWRLVYFFLGTDDINRLILFMSLGDEVFIRSINKFLTVNYISVNKFISRYTNVIVDVIRLFVIKIKSPFLPMANGVTRSRGVRQFRGVIVSFSIRL